VRAATRPGLRVGVLTKAELHQSATRWAQGGIAAVLGDDADSTDLHLADTLASGAGLCDVDAVRVLVDEGPTRVHDLIALGAVFDTDTEGRLDLAREGGHSKARIVHAGGVATGAEIERALVEAVRATAAVVLEGWFALDLLVEGGRCRGVVALDPSGVSHEVRATHTLLATGGAGQLFWVTTNPREATGDGIAMGLRAGVVVADVEFMQFHPTALHHPAMPRPLLSEALRGHGAVLRDMKGDRFVDELLPRDQVSRAMTSRMLQQDTDHLWLDATGLEAFGQRFPTIAAALAAVGLDPTIEWLPIAPAAHYLSGGLLTDLDGATSLPGLWACGEVACTGVHGANRLASNSLLEGMVFAPRVVEAIDAGRDGPVPTGAMAALADDGGGIPVRAVERLPTIERRTAERTGGEADEVVGAGLERRRIDLQQAMTRGAGVVRTASSLVEALGALAVPTGPSAGAAELANLATLGRALVAAALQRTESRGNHWRADHEDLDPSLAVRLVHNLP
jgi:L-aspartate oxidase